MKVPFFRSPQTFEVKHTHASVVLGAYPLAINVKKALEFGCGNAVSSLIMALNNRCIERMVAVDIDEIACLSAREFIEVNGLTDKIEIVNERVSEIPKILGYESFDFVFFNPPFHIGGKVSTNERRFTERNTDVFEEFVESSAKVLKNGGYFRFVIAPALLLKAFHVLEQWKLTPKWFVPIYGKENADSKLVLVEGIKKGKTGGFKIKPPIFLNEVKLNG